MKQQNKLEPYTQKCRYCGSTLFIRTFRADEECNVENGKVVPRGDKDSIETSTESHIACASCGKKYKASKLSRLPRESAKNPLCAVCQENSADGLGMNFLPHAPSCRNCDRERHSRCKCTRPCYLYLCFSCNRVVPHCMVPDNERPGQCDDCWAKAHGK